MLPRIIVRFFEHFKSMLLLGIVLFAFHQLNAQNTDSLNRILQNNESDSVRFSTAIQLYSIYLQQNNIAEAEKMLAIAKQHLYSNNPDVQLNRINNLISAFAQTENYDSTAVYLQKMAQIYLKHNKKEMYITYMNQAAYYQTFTGKNDKSVQMLLDVLRFAEKNNMPQEFPNIYMYLGFSIRDVNLPKAKEYFEKSIKSSKDTLSQAFFTSLHEIGNIHVMLLNNDSALVYYLRALKIKEQLNNNSIVYSYHDISLAYKQIGEFNKSVEYMIKAIKIFELNQEKYMLAVCYTNLANTYQLMEKYAASDEYLKKAMILANELKLNNIFENVYLQVYRLNKATGNYKQALEGLENMVRYNDTINRKETEKQIADLDKKYQTEKKEAEILILQKQKLADDAIIRQQKTMGIAGSIIILLSITTAIIFFRGREKQKLANQQLSLKNMEINKQKEEIFAQADNLAQANVAITKQKEEIEESHRKITDSIAYASRIQQALLPTYEDLAPSFPEHFVLYQPKDVVSGDFYYFRKIENILLVAVADCTGHGVPGALVSMLGIAFLNEIVRMDDVTSPAMVLEELRNKVKASLKHSGKYSETRDGMDIAFCAIDENTGRLEYAGANNSLYIIRNAELIEIKATSNPIGAYIKESAFENNVVQLQPGDMLYMFSDGYYDQFGGTGNTKMMKKNFKLLLTQLAHLPAEDQKQKLSEHLNSWKNDYFQNDDVLVVGLRANLKPDSMTAYSG